MTDNRLSGLALIVGSVGVIITMGLHPTGHIAAVDIQPMIRKLIMVHALGLACLPVLFLGAWGFCRQLSAQARLAAIGLVLYAFALLAVMNAAVADGLIAPSVLRQIVASAGAPSAIDSWRMIQHYNFYANQAYAQVFVAASSIAIIVWSAALLRATSRFRGLGIYGCIIGPLILLALFSGHLTLDAHGFGVIVLLQSIWFGAAGIFLLRSSEGVTAAHEAIASLR